MNTHNQKRNGYHYKRENLMTAICIIPDPYGGKARGIKYRKVADLPATIARFERFVQNTFPGCSHINYYGGLSKEFLRRTTFFLLKSAQ